MIQITDTHRLAYKNAKIIAYSVANRTERINFYNLTDDPDTNTIKYDDVGNMVYTNENGYVCYGANRLTSTGIAVMEDAIVQVSLDNGTSYPIEFIVTGMANPVLRSDIKTLSYYDEGGNVQVFNPIGSENRSLPRYALLSQVASNEWKESAVKLEASDTDYTISTWDKVIEADAGAPATINIDTVQMHAGQVVVFTNRATNRTVHMINSETSADVPHSLDAAKAYLLVNHVGANLPYVIELGAI